ncbi:hypothetical protein Ddye_006709 [Dipteronia dyeriana]|uniref:Uncharacterized protein n=1 Tax=Dipteronia dyeriana TaxID=168575 RepID=A0AAE0CQZ8_9ROSI|nr:hypothetical protein Ddye_006709 [Dipteronia dyeriana]
MRVLNFQFGLNHHPFLCLAIPPSRKKSIDHTTSYHSWNLEQASSRRPYLESGADSTSLISQVKKIQSYDTTIYGLLRVW